MSYPYCQLDRRNASSSSQAPAYSFLDQRRSKFILELSLQVVLVLVLYSLLQLVLSGVQNLAFYEIGLFLIAFTVAWQTLALSRGEADSEPSPKIHRLSLMSIALLCDWPTVCHIPLLPRNGLFHPRTSFGPSCDCERRCFCT